MDEPLFSISAFTAQQIICNKYFIQLIELLCSGGRWQPLKMDSQWKTRQWHSLANFPCFQVNGSGYDLCLCWQPQTHGRGVLFPSRFLGFIHLFSFVPWAAASHATLLFPCCCHDQEYFFCFSLGAQDHGDASAQLHPSRSQGSHGAMRNDL